MPVRADNDQCNFVKPVSALHQARLRLEPKSNAVYNHSNYEFRISILIRSEKNNSKRYLVADNITVYQASQEPRDLQQDDSLSMLHLHSKHWSLPAKTGMVCTSPASKYKHARNDVVYALEMAKALVAMEAMRTA